MKPIENSATTKVFKLVGGNADTDLPVEPWNSDAGNRVHTSYWVPSEGELGQLEDGATIALSVWGLLHPTVALGIGPALYVSPLDQAAALLRTALAADQSAKQSGQVGAFSDEFRAELQTFLGLETI